MTNTHTPGPWTLIQDSLTDDVRIHTDNGRHVADLTTRDNIRMATETKGERETRWVEVVANARLIAAAPELLEAARLVLARFDLEPEGAVFPGSALRETLRRAIVKAEFTNY